MSLLGDAISGDEFAEATARKAWPIFEEGDYPFVVAAAGAEVDERAGAFTTADGTVIEGVIKSEKVVYAPILLDVTNEQTGEVTHAYHNVSLISFSPDAKKRNTIRQMATQFFASLGLGADAINSLTDTTQVVGLGGRARFRPGKSNTGRDRNEVAYFLTPNGQA